MDGKAIFNSYIAKQLLLKGNKIIDLQPDKRKYGSVIFYFEETSKLFDDLEKLSKK